MNHYTAAYNSPVGPIVIESDGEALTGLRFSNEQACDTSTAQEKAGEEANTTIPIIAETLLLRANDHVTCRDSIRKAPLSRSAFGQLC